MKTRPTIDPDESPLRPPTPVPSGLRQTGSGKVRPSWSGMGSGVLPSLQDRQAGPRDWGPGESGGTARGVEGGPRPPASRPVGSVSAAADRV